MLINLIGSKFNFLLEIKKLFLLLIRFPTTLSKTGEIHIKIICNELTKNFLFYKLFNFCLQLNNEKNTEIVF